MKKLVLFLLFITGIGYAQIVNIPDANFKARLLEANVGIDIASTQAPTYNSNNDTWSVSSYNKIDTNNDGEIQESEASLIKYLRLDSSAGIIDLQGISGFVNIEYLNVSWQQLQVFNFDDLLNLKTLIWRNINVQNSLNINNPSLMNLDVSHVNSGASILTSLNVNNLPNLSTLKCDNNNITSLSFNNLLNLTSVECGWNDLTSITFNNVPNLTSLNCINNLITELDLSNFTNLTSATIYNNDNLNFVNLSGTSISYFDIDPSFEDNIIINLSNCTNLITFSGVSNADYINLSNCINLTNINCPSVSILNGIDLTGCTSLNSITTQFLLFENLDLSNLPNLININIVAGDFKTIDLSGSINIDNLNFLAGGNFLLESINLKGIPNISDKFTQYVVGGTANLPNFEYICVNDDQVNTIQNLYTSANNTQVVVGSYCSFNPSGNYNTITGTIRFDSNSNGCDSNDLVFPNIRMKMTQWGINSATFSNVNGVYTFYTTFADQLVEPSVENPSWFNFTPQSAIISFTNNNNNIFTQDFCISPNGVHPDLEAVIMPISVARPGFDATYKIVYKNKGNQTLSGNVSLTFDDDRTDFVSANPNPDNLVLNTLNWNYANLLPFESKIIYLVLNVNSPVETPAVNIGDVLNFATTINPIAGDEMPNDNVFSYNQTVVGAYDPNNIECLEGDVVSPSYIGQYLHYVVNFENTGNFPAENVVVKIVIDTTKYNINSLQLLNTSHNSYTKITDNIVEFIFENIALDSGGHGNVLFKIQTTNSLVSGDMVTKRGDIFFDYNAPIDTGIANTVFQSLNNSAFEKDNSVVIFPNPTQSIVNVKSDNSIKSIQLYDVQGRLLQTKLTEENSTSIDISDKSKGIYFLKITSDKGIKVERIVKE